MKYVVYKDQVDEWRWQLVADNGQIIATSGEGYVRKRDCLHGIDLVKTSNDARVIYAEREQKDAESQPNE